MTLKSKLSRNVIKIVERIGSIFGVNRSLYDKSMKLGTLLEHDMRIIFSYRAISDLTSDLCGSFFFQIADNVINSLLSFIYNFDHYA